MRKEWQPSAIILRKCKSCMVKAELPEPQSERFYLDDSEEMDVTLYRDM